MFADKTRTILNFDDRDPKNINEHVKANIDDVIAEHNIHSFDFIWKASFYTFTYTRNFIYKLITFFCGIPIAFCCGCTFACLTFEMTWCVTPFIHILTITFGTYKKLVTLVVSTVLAPLYETFALVFSKINIRVTNVVEYQPSVNDAARGQIPPVYNYSHNALHVV